MVISPWLFTHPVLKVSRVIKAREDEINRILAIKETLRRLGLSLSSITELQDEINRIFAILKCESLSSIEFPTLDSILLISSPKRLLQWEKKKALNISRYNCQKMLTLLDPDRKERIRAILSISDVAPINHPAKNVDELGVIKLWIETNKIIQKSEAIEYYNFLNKFPALWCLYLALKSFRDKSRKERG